MNLCLLKFKILNQDLSWCLASTKIQSQVLNLARIDSGAQEERSHQVHKRNLARRNQVWINSTWKEDPQEGLCLELVSLEYF